LVIYSNQQYKWQDVKHPTILSLLKIFFATMKKFTTKKKLFNKHHVIVGSLVLKEK
jgi:hypothetical protein